MDCSVVINILPPEEEEVLIITEILPNPVHVRRKRKVVRDPTYNPSRRIRRKSTRNERVKDPDYAQSTKFAR